MTDLAAGLLHPAINSLSKQKCLSCSAEFETLLELTVHMTLHHQLLDFNNPTTTVSSQIWNPGSFLNTAVSTPKSQKPETKPKAVSKAKQTYPSFILPKFESETPGFAPLKCYKCSEKFTHINDLSLHIMVSHVDETPEKKVDPLPELDLNKLLKNYTSSVKTTPLPAAKPSRKRVSGFSIDELLQ